MDITILSNLPEPLKSILIGGAGDFVGSVTADIVGRLLGAVGYQVARRYKIEPKRQALDRALALALFQTVQDLAEDPELMAHYLTLFGDWLARDAVTGELSLMIDPRPEAALDFELLRGEFAASGYDADWLGADVTFEETVERFVAAFRDAAKGEAELQGEIQIDLLERLVEQVEEQVRLLRQMADGHAQGAPGSPVDTGSAMSVGRDEITASDGSAANTGSGAAVAGDGNTVVTGSVGGDVLAQGASKTVVHRTSDPGVRKRAAREQAERDALRCYLERLRRYCQALPLAALGGEESGDKDVTLDQVYIDLETTTRIPLTEEEKQARKERRATFADIEAMQRGEETRPLAALEAAAQSTRLALLGEPGAGKSTFVRMLLGWQAAAHLGECAPPGGCAADWLPILVVLRDLAPRLAALDLAASSQERREQALAAAVRAQALEDLGRLEAAESAEPVRRALRDGKCLLVLDGLDEVPPELRPRVRQAVAAVNRVYRPQRLIVTCRVRSYTGETILPAFQAHTLAPFDEARIRRFAQAWYHAQKTLGRLDAVESQRRAEDLASAALTRDLVELSANPMLLTTMAIIHQKEIGLPRERVRLYDLAVDVLLRRWQKRMAGEELTPSPRLTAFLKDDLRLRAAVERLAYEAQDLGRAHAGNQSQAGERAQAGDLTRGQALALLESEEYLGSAGLAGEFLGYVDQRAGLLVGRGGDASLPATYAFPHRTFQEYLAGCYLAGLRDTKRAFYARAGEGDAWSLAAMLGAEELYYRRRNAPGLLDLAYALCPAGAPGDERDRRSLLWSGQMAALVGRRAIEQDAGDPNGGAAYLARILPRLVDLLGSNLAPVERAEAGRVLGKLGDPRPEVIDVDALEFCLVPDGPFWMGSEQDQDPEAQSSESPQKQIRLRPYYIGRCPVTNGQFKAFVDEGGYGEAGWWNEAAQDGYWQDGLVKGWNDDEGRGAPYGYGEPFDHPNHPVVGVTWYEALAFTRWLTARWQSRGWLAPGWAIGLPTEAQWEKAARGGQRIPMEPVIVPAQAGLPEAGAPRLCENPMPYRTFPWGAGPVTPDHANYFAALINTPSVPGTFPKGASPYGVLDMSGNVWEWCATKWRGNYQEAADEDPAGESARVLRGGAFGSEPRSVRCAYRDYYAPSYRNYFFGFRVVASPIIHDAGG